MVQVGRQQGSTRVRRRIVLGIHGLALLALPGAFAFAAPPSTFHHPFALAILIALAACAYGGEVALKTSVPARFDATLALALVALDLYNLANRNTGTTYQQGYDFATNGAAWLRPTSILNPRFVRFNVTVDF